MLYHKLPLKLPSASKEVCLIKGRLQQKGIQNSFRHMKLVVVLFFKMLQLHWLTGMIQDAEYSLYDLLFRLSQIRLFPKNSYVHPGDKCSQYDRVWEFKITLKKPGKNVLNSVFPEEYQ